MVSGPGEPSSPLTCGDFLQSQPLGALPGSLWEEGWLA